MKVLALACSLRKGSINKKLLGVAVEVMRRHGAEVEHALLEDFALPLFNQDLIDGNGGQFPEPADRLRQRFLDNDAFVLATPEYNFSIAAPVKNAIDWLSRFRPMPFRDKPGFIMATSTGVIGGIRGLWQTRIPLEGCGALLYADMFALGQGPQKFDGDGKLTDVDALARLDGQLAGFLGFAQKLTAK